MGEETLAEKRDWLHNQLNGAISFAVLATFFVFLRCIGLRVLNWKKKIVIKLFLLEEILLLASLISFLPLCACAIGKDSYLEIRMYKLTGISGCASIPLLILPTRK